MKLFQFAYSPFAAKVRKCLDIKRLAYEVIEVPMVDRRELVAVTGGSIMVPVLVDGDNVISDSPRITAHLERYAPSLRPAPLSAAAVVFESWADNVLEDVTFRIAAPAVDERIVAHNGGRADARPLFRLIKERRYGPGCIEAWRAQRGQLDERLATMLAPLEETLCATSYLLGNTPTVADAAVYGQLYMIEWAMPGYLDRLPPLVADWYRRVDSSGRTRSLRHAQTI